MTTTPISDSFNKLYETNLEQGQAIFSLTLFSAVEGIATTATITVSLC